MQFTWNADTVRWYLNANDYTGFYKRLAEIIAPALKGYKSLCDLGCGLGLFDFEVASIFEKIECIDINETVLQSIRERASRQGITNIVSRMDDCSHITGAWDVVFMSFFGSRELDRFLPQCKKLIAVVSVTSDSEMFPMKQRYRKNTVDDTVKYLEQKKIGYRLTYRHLDFGQPFTSLEDARRCVKCYAPDITDAETDEFLREKLKETHGENYPYYLPRIKSAGIFELDGMLR
jgi:SAM-dependent methyltransferase